MIVTAKNFLFDSKLCLADQSGFKQRKIPSMYIVMLGTNNVYVGAIT